MLHLIKVVFSGFCLSLFLSLQAEMSSWIRSIHSSMPASNDDDMSPAPPLTRAMTMPPMSPSEGEGGGVTMRNKEGKEKDREKRFSFFGKKK